MKWTPAQTKKADVYVQSVLDKEAVLLPNTDYSTEISGIVQDAWQYKYGQYKKEYTNLINTGLKDKLGNPVIMHADAVIQAAEA